MENEKKNFFIFSAAVAVSGAGYVRAASSESRCKWEKSDSELKEAPSIISASPSCSLSRLTFLCFTLAFLRVCSVLAKSRKYTFH
jgi:hypothetical protein